MTATSGPTSVEQGEETRPLLSDRNFKLALFAFNIDGGMCATSAEGALKISWDNQLRLAQMADRAGFEAILPAARWKGYGGTSGWADNTFEAVTLASAFAAVTDYSNVIGTVQVNSMHPVLAAKQAATIDHISGGRFGFNLVAGWNPSEVELFGGGKMLDHEGRYARTGEWLEFVKQLWTEDDEFDFEGDYFSAKGAVSGPHPLQKPHPLIINAAGSDRGLQFVAEHADICFTSAETLEELEVKVPRLRQKIRDLAGREIKVLTSATILCRDTEAEAKKWWDYVVKDKGDREAAAKWAGAFSKESKTYSEEKFRELQAQLDKAIAGIGTLQITTSPEQVADTIARLSAIGIDGMTVSFMTDWEEELEQFVRDVMPLVEQQGLREPFAGPGTSPVG